MLRNLPRYIFAAGAMLLPLLATPPAKAAGAVYYSPSQNGYGWCAGYSSGRAHSCAKSHCDEWGGNDCSLIVECDGGWGAVALAQDPVSGIGALCGVTGALFARYAALANCMAASRTLCWTSTTFNGNGSEQSEADNRAFDMTWYAQVMLQIAKFDPGTADGELGPGTRAAIRAFQTKIGREPTGEIDDALFWRLVDAVGGVQRFVRIVEEQVLSKERPEFGDIMGSHSASPAAALSFSEELLGRSEDDRRTALATFLSASGTACSVPARETRATDAASDTWEVDCAEGSYLLMMSDSSWIVVNMSGDSDSPAGNESDQPPEETAPARNGRAVTPHVVR